MKRLLTMLPIAVLAFAGFTPAQAHTDDVYPTEDTPIVIQCKGTFGLNSDGDFEFKEDGGLVGPARPCVAWAPDTASPLPSDPPPADLAGVLTWLNWSPVGHATNPTLRANGDYACGTGPLSSASAERPSRFSYWHGFTARVWQVDWDGSFSNGIGEITGTARLTHSESDIRSVTGKMVVASNSVHCDDNGAEAILTLVLE